MPTTLDKARPALALRIGLWTAQLAVFAVFSLVGATKMLTPIPELAKVMPWTGEAPEIFVRIIGLIDLAGGLGILLPALTRMRPGLTVAAAAGCAALQLCAIAFHVWRGEAAETPLNLALLALSVFILWGRATKAPVAER